MENFIHDIVKEFCLDIDGDVFLAANPITGKVVSIYVNLNDNKIKIVK